MIILDNGHGINTKGKRSPLYSEFLEFEFNRDIVRRISADLNALNISSIILVPEIEDIGLKERVRRANTISSRHKQSVLISIHANAGGGTGWEVWTSVGETKSDDIANLFYIEAYKHLKSFPMRKDMSDGDVDKESQFYILRNTICPAILTENLFMDTEKDVQYLMSEVGRRTIALLHIQAILKIYKL